MKEIILYGESKDITQDNIEKLKTLFPEIVIEDFIDFEKFKEILGEHIDASNERYEFIWPGKSKAIHESQKPSNGTLIPSKQDSKKWDSTQNLYIEGDNLEVLKLLQKSYYNKVKMIYIDPPYNTGKDFVYTDNYKDNLENYLEITGQVQKVEGLNNVKLSTNTESNGRFHSNWLNMMYPRLKLARNLLTDNGVIFISINDIEVNNLRKICDEIFGEENFVTDFIWMKGKEGGNDSSIMRSHYEHVLCFCKNIDAEKIINLDEKDLSRHITELPEKNLIKGIKEEINPGERFQLINLSKQKDYTVKIPLIDGEILEWPSYAPQNRINEWIENGKLFVGSKRVPYVKSFLKDELQGKKPSNIIDSSYGTTKAGSIEIRNIFGSKNIFTYPKPSSFIKRLLKIGSTQDSIVLDFFSGSASTAQAVIQDNLENNQNKRFILVQIPEPLEENSEAFDEGFKNICEIGKERIRRVGDKIVEDSRRDDLDIGFKVFKLDSSNLTKWNPNVDDLESSLVSAADNIVEGRTSLDLVYEIMLKYGLELTLPVEEISKDIFSVAYGSLVVCLRDDVTSDVINEIFELVNGSAVSRVVFKDNGFKSDADKTNIKENLRVNGVDEFITI